MHFVHERRSSPKYQVDGDAEVRKREEREEEERRRRRERERRESCRLLVGAARKGAAPWRRCIPSTCRPRPLPLSRLASIWRTLGAKPTPVFWSPDSCFLLQVRANGRRTHFSCETRSNALKGEREREREREREEEEEEEEKRERSERQQTLILETVEGAWAGQPPTRLG